MTTTHPVGLQIDGGLPDSLKQESLVLECGVCVEQYGSDFDHQPRSLRCGHTFCTKCLMKLLTSRGLKCPMCNTPHPLPSPDVMLLPINYAVQDIMKKISTRQQDSIMGQRELPLCGVCNKETASIVCIDCDPGNHFKFCVACDSSEHTRPFGPAQRHRRFPIDKAPIPSTKISCSRHTSVTAVYYLVGVDEFACNLCKADEDWSVRGSQVDLLTNATKNMRLKVQKLTKYTGDISKKLTESKSNLERTMSSLEPESMALKAEISKTFSQCIEVLQERQRKLLSNVEVEVKNRKETLKKQHKTVVASSLKYRDAYETLNSLISKTDTDFILHYRTAIRRLEPLAGEDKSLLRPVATHDIPFYINRDVQKQLHTLGAVGGGLTPLELEASPSGSQGTLLELYWQLPEGCGKLNRFQVEYEQILNTTIDSLGGDLESSDMTYKLTEPHYHEVPGNELNTYVDYLCPGYEYRFRIRSENDAGFGMWSDSITERCKDFPFTLQYTKKIHRILIPTNSYYRITAKGAKAADGKFHSGGKGAIISGTFSLKAGDILIILCGGMSSRHHYHSGGGGGTFVALNEITQEKLLVVAGGGGGTRGADDKDFSGRDANIYEDGFDGLGKFGRGGINGAAGEDAKDEMSPEGPSWGSGGAGFAQDSSTASSFKSGGHAGQNGGFGGGGGVGMYGGGGGGGYSGGGGGRGGGGGGSYIHSLALEVTREVGCEGHGSVLIEKVLPPYPMSNSLESHKSTSVSSTAGGDTTSTNGSSTNRLLHLDSTSSNGSSSTGAITSSLSSKAMLSNEMSIGTIPELDPLHQSPASTGQVMDHPGNPLPVTFTLDGSTEKQPGDFMSHDMSTLSNAAVPQPGSIIPSNIMASGITSSSAESTLVPFSHLDGKGLAGSKPQLPTSQRPLEPPAVLQEEQILQYQQPPHTATAATPAVVETRSPPTTSALAGDYSTSQWVIQHEFDSMMRHEEQKQQQPSQEVPQPPVKQQKQDTSPPLTQQQLQSDLGTESWGYPPNGASLQQQQQQPQQQQASAYHQNW